MTGYVCRFVPAAVFAVLIDRPLEAQSCMGPAQLYGANTANSIGLLAQNGVSPSWLSGGIAFWDACGSDPGFPALFCDQPGDYTFAVWFMAGNSIGSGCGSADPTVEWDADQGAWIVRGGNIYLYERDGFGFPCDNSDTARARLVAHEIGHILGLDESSCTSHIMGGSSSVQTAECEAVNGLWLTLMEDLLNQCNASCWTRCDANAQCPEQQMHQNPPGGNDPLVLDLANDGIATAAGADAVWFDLYGDGTSERLSWPRGDDAFLWTDLNGNMRIDNGAELFGVGTVLPDGTRARHGFEALAMYDVRARGGNDNGRIESGDAIWNRLRLWRDLNGDGICDPGEIAPIHRYGVRQIDLSWIFAPWTDSAGTVHLLRGTYRKHVTDPGGARYGDYAVEALALREWQ